MSRKAAPRREVLDVTRHGDWGDIVWLHTLACGHVTPRKRRAASTHLNCEACLERKDEPGFALPVDPVAVKAASAELATAHTQAALAARFGVASDAVQVSLGDDFDIGFALIVLTRDEIRRILSSSS